MYLLDDAQCDHSRRDKPNSRNRSRFLRRRVQQPRAPPFICCPLTHLIGVHQFPRPLWQEAAVTKFLASIPNGTYVGLFNHSGRVWVHCFAIEFLNRQRMAVVLTGIPGCLNTRN
jgi:hypothetical protein